MLLLFLENIKILVARNCQFVEVIVYLTTYEIVMINKCKKQFSSTKLRGYFFYFAQCIHRSMQNEGSKVRNRFLFCIKSTHVVGYCICTSEQHIVNILWRYLDWTAPKKDWLKRATNLYTWNMETLWHDSKLHHPNICKCINYILKKYIEVVLHT